MPLQQAKDAQYSEYETTETATPVPAAPSTLDAFESALEAECPSAGPFSSSSFDFRSEGSGTHRRSCGTGVATSGTRQKTIDVRDGTQAADPAATAVPSPRTWKRPTSCSVSDSQPIIIVKNRGMGGGGRRGSSQSRGSTVSSSSPRRWRMRRCGVSCSSLAPSSSSAIADDTESAAGSSSAQTHSTVSSLASWSAPSRHLHDGASRSLPSIPEHYMGGGGLSVVTRTTVSSWAIPTVGGLLVHILSSVNALCGNGSAKIDADPCADPCAKARRRNRGLSIDRRTRLLLILPAAMLGAASFALLGSHQHKKVLEELRKMEAHQEAEDLGQLPGFSAGERIDVRGGRTFRGGMARRKMQPSTAGTTEAQIAHRSSSVVDAEGQRRRQLFELTLEHIDRFPFSNLADTVEPRPSGDGAHVNAFYWQIPRAGSSTMKHILGSCLDKVQASRMSKDYCDVDTDKLKVCETKLGRYVNADTSDDPGLRRSAKLGLARSGLADVVVSSRFLHAASLFDSDPASDADKTSNTVDSSGHDSTNADIRGRAFTVFRHPVVRVASMFYYLRDATWERNYDPSLKSMSLVEYSKLPTTPHNWMVRWLTGKNHEAELSRDDLAFAKKVLDRKFLVLLTEDLPAGVERLIEYMGWDQGEGLPEGGLQCARSAAAKVAARNSNSERKDISEEERKALEDINDLDIELYEHAAKLYESQWSAIKGPSTSTSSKNAEEEGQTKTSDEKKGKDTAATAAAADGTTEAKMEKPFRAAVRAAPSTAEALKAAKERERPFPPMMAEIAKAFGPLVDYTDEVVAKVERVESDLTPTKVYPEGAKKSRPIRHKL